MGARDKAGKQESAYPQTIHISLGMISRSPSTRLYFWGNIQARADLY